MEEVGKQQEEAWVKDEEGLPVVAALTEPISLVSVAPAG